MQSSSDITAAVNLLKQTLPEMQKRNMPTTPENYAIWYEYVSGRNASLVNEIHLLDLNKTAFTSAIHKDLYQKHIASEREALVNQLSDSAKNVINNFLEQARQEGQGLGVYSKALHDISTEAEAMQSIGELKLMVAQLIEHTKNRELATSTMQESLLSMTREMQQLKEEVARLSGESSIDTLTRIPTKNVFIEDLETHAAMAQSDGEAMAVVLLEVDKFSEFRETFGDTIADKVLKFIATLFKKNLKGGDTIARYGTQSFAMILPDTSAKDAHSVADNLCKRLAKQTLSDSAAKVQLGTITVSAAITNLKEDDSASDLLQRAETALRKAIKEGGNRVATA